MKDIKMIDLEHNIIITREKRYVLSRRVSHLCGSTSGCIKNINSHVDPYRPLCRN